MGDGEAVDVVEVFHFEDGKPSFEDFGQVNGGISWYASDLARCLGYENPAPFNKAVQKAMTVCASLEIPIQDNFKECKREMEGCEVHDWKLSRFACTLAVLNGDISKPGVAKAKAYFAVLAEKFQAFLEDSDNVERVLIREDVSERDKNLSAAARKGGLVKPVEFAMFKDAGYRGMYNMRLQDLCDHKGIPKGRVLFDFMGRQELAANLFRLTETEAKIRKEGIHGQGPLESAAHAVGQKVRHTMIETSGTYPEALPIAGDIKKVKSGLKGAQRLFQKKDKAALPAPPDEEAAK